MTWFRSDDDLPEHPKSDVLEQLCPTWADLAAAWMAWHHLGCDCARRRTDGVFARSRAHRAVRLPPEVVDTALERLVAAGFLERAAEADTFVFHDWQDYQPVKAELDAERKAKTARQNRWRQKQRAARAAVDGGVDASTDASVDGAVDTPVDASTDATTRRSTGASRDASPRASRDASRVDGAPSRPVPSRPETTSPSTSAADDAGASTSAGAPREPVKAPMGGDGTGGAQGGATKLRKAPKTDEPAPLPGTPAAAALEALRGSPTLRGIVDRPNALAATVTSGAFPAVDVPAEIRRAEAWLFANPANAKSNGARFLTGWLTRAQGRAPRVAGHAPAAAEQPESGFDRFIRERAARPRSEAS